MRADGLKVCVAGHPEFSRTAELIAALRGVGCEVTLASANAEDLTRESGDAVWSRQLLMECEDLVNEFDRQVDAGIEADVFILCPPCSRSLHMLAGASIAAGGRLVVLLAIGPPELLYRQGDTLCTTVDEVLAAVVAEAEQRKDTRYAEVLAC